MPGLSTSAHPDHPDPPAPPVLPVLPTHTGAAAPRVTRLAPSPTGALHLGNARTFLVTWALARRLGWRILFRIEDLDGARVKPDAAQGIADTLRWLGIDWDDGPLVQSADLAPYRAAMGVLAARALVYPSAATRSEVERAASAPHEGEHDTVFPASLRPPLARRAFDDEATNWRFAVPPGAVPFDDALAGPQAFDPGAIVGDFVVWTRRGQPAYQLAVVVDDHRQGVTDVVRGADLLDSGARQLLLYRALGLAPEPRYWHVPLVVGTDGRRLAKRHGDTRVEHYRARGVPAEAVIGLVARWCGPSPADAAGTLCTTARAFLERFDPDRMRRERVVFTQEDDRWLMAQR